MQKVLVLHGAGNNAAMMKRYMRVYEEESTLDFTYVTAPHKASPQDVSMIPPKLVDIYGEDNLYSFGPVRQNEDGEWWITQFEESVKWLVNHINETGPYDGVACFSQSGYIMRAALNAHLLSFDCPVLRHRPKFLIYFCVPDTREYRKSCRNPEDTTMVYEGEVDIPCFVLYGQQS